ncbi:hypothetical protein VHEMI03522 [[Torrubiella] hemipterigena]|uniref:PH domain-containing protein n=1 Tax=[Torrubiella] hemipterigena TaxID=1531966 RepID=A0A0A1SSR2_9HYPO|nr:hypothetical protein VHEMI03522 [[Torrubiella] hemipterigena]
MSPSNVSTTHLAVPESNRYFPSFSLRSRKSEFSLSQLKTTQEQAPEPPKLAKRESRLGLRRMFSRSKLKPEDSAPPPVPPVPVYTERTSLGASRSTVYLNQPNPSETALSVMSGSAAAASDTNLPGTSRTFGSIGRGSRRSFMPRPLLGGKSAADELEIPALYSAYHQSIRQATLQAPTISGDAVLSLQEAPSSQPQDGDVQDDTSRLTKRSKDKAKKGDDKSSPFEWTSKIYLLTTSANLLQYTADGHYERVPERVLKLTANSAAFVTDCIPGKHWVLRISADVLTTLTPDPASMVDHRSLFSKEPNRRASNFLMVFDNADDMDGWIVAVRSEILKLKDAETQDTVGERQIRERASQRTLTARDLSRLESSETVQCYPTSERKQSTAAITVSDYDKTNEQCLDDVSVTNSVVSQEGQQLESLRDSNHRLSVMSTSQDTFGTSAASSPATSPTIESFPRQSDDAHRKESIIDKAVEMVRQSSSGSYNASPVQPVAPFMGLPEIHPSTSPLYTAPPPGPLTTPKAALNVPMFCKPTPPVPEMPISPPRENLARRNFRSKPPTSLKDSRPLSVVADCPSPQVVPSETMGGHSQFNSLASFKPTFKGRYSITPKAIPARQASMSTIIQANKQLSRSSSHSHLDRLAPRTPNDVVSLQTDDLAGEANQELNALSSYTWKNGRRPSLVPFEEEGSRPSSSHSAAPPPPPRAPPPSTPLPPIPTSTGASNSALGQRKSLSVRRSMPQIIVSLQAQGPRASRMIPSVPQM